MSEWINEGSQEEAAPKAEAAKTEPANTVPPVKGPKTKKEPLPVEKRDRILALVMFVAAYLASEVFGLLTNPGYYGYGVTLLGIVYAVMVFAYGRNRKTVFPKETYFWLAVLILGAGSYSFVYNQSLKVFHPLFLRLVALYVTLVINTALITGKTGSYFIFDGINMLFVIPFENFAAQWQISGKEVRKLRFFATLFKALLGLVVALPLLLIVAALLGSADDQFAELLVRVVNSLGDHFFQTIWTFVASLPVGCYLFGLFYGSAHKRGTEHIKKESIESSSKACAVIPQVSFYAVLFVICLLYVLFIGLQGGYYFSAVRGVLPDGFTYSTYARQGFFELVAISLINIGVIGVTQLFAKGKGRIIKGFYILLSILTLLLILTAMTKMALYINAHGLTPLRVIPSVFMVFMALVFVLIIVHQVKPVPIARISLYAFAAGYIILSVFNMDGFIAGYNLDRYQKGTLEEVDAIALKNGGIASLPPMYKVWSTTGDEELKRQLEGIAEVIQYRESEIIDISDQVKYDSIPKYHARVIIKEMTKENP